MTKQDIVEYVKQTPHNTNPNVIGAMIDGLPSQAGEVKSFNGRKGDIMPQANDYTPEMVGADPAGSANDALEEAKEYADQKTAELVDSAPETMNTLRELSEAISNNKKVVDVLDEAISKKVDIVQVPEIIEETLEEAQKSGDFDGSRWHNGSGSIADFGPWLIENFDMEDGLLNDRSNLLGEGSTYEVKEGKLYLNETTGGTGYLTLKNEYNEWIKPNKYNGLTFIVDLTPKSYIETPDGDSNKFAEYGVFSGGSTMYYIPMYNFSDKCFEIRKTTTWPLNMGRDNSEVIAKVNYELNIDQTYELAFKFKSDRIMICVDRKKIIDYVMPAGHLNSLDYLIAYPRYCEFELDKVRVCSKDYLCDTKTGDLYIDNNNGNYFECIGLDHWEYKGCLKGDTGATGPQGAAGAKGNKGADGISVTHYWDGDNLVLTSASGTTWTYLKGNDGAPGKDGSMWYCGTEVDFAVINPIWQEEFNYWEAPPSYTYLFQNADSTYYTINQGNYYLSFLNMEGIVSPMAFPQDVVDRMNSDLGLTLEFDFAPFGYSDIDFSQFAIYAEAELEDGRTIYPYFIYDLYQGYFRIGFPESAPIDYRPGADGSIWHESSRNFLKFQQFNNISLKFNGDEITYSVEKKTMYPYNNFHNPYGSPIVKFKGLYLSPQYCSIHLDNFKIADKYTQITDRRDNIFVDGGAIIPNIGDLYLNTNNGQICRMVENDNASNAFKRSWQYVNTLNLGSGGSVNTDQIVNEVINRLDKWDGGGWY